jgi:hypothetical protein
MNDNNTTNTEWMKINARISNMNYLYTAFGVAME